MTARAAASNRGQPGITSAAGPFSLLADTLELLNRLQQAEEQLQEIMIRRDLQRFEETRKDRENLLLALARLQEQQAALLPAGRQRFLDRENLEEGWQPETAVLLEKIRRRLRQLKAQQAVNSCLLKGWRTSRSAAPAAESYDRRGLAGYRLGGGRCINICC